jgi:hypothetical protein
VTARLLFRPLYRHPFCVAGWHRVLRKLNASNCWMPQADAQAECIQLPEARERGACASPFPELGKSLVAAGLLFGAAGLLGPMLLLQMLCGTVRDWHCGSWHCGRLRGGSGAVTACMTRASGAATRQPDSGLSCWRMHGELCAELAERDPDDPLKAPDECGHVHGGWITYSLRGR